MFLIAHTTSGWFIGKLVPWPILSFLIGFASHFVLDAIPHDFKRLQNWLNKEPKKISRYILALIIDLILSTGIYFFLNKYFDQNFNLSIVCAIFGSWLPDFLWPMARIFGVKFFEPFAKLHCQIDHWSEKILSNNKIIQKFVWLTQIIIMLGIFFILKLLK